MKRESETLQQWHYTYSGLRVTSDLMLPEWSRFEIARPAGGCDVRFTMETAVSEEPDCQATWLVESRRHHFHVGGIGTFRVEDGCRVSLTPTNGAGLPELRLFLLGSAWAALCYQRNLLPLHGSVMQVGGEAVAFCGPSGAGKSSTAAWLAERGWPLISDDLCVVDFSNEGRPGVWPSTGRLKLWDTALDALGRGTDGLTRDYFRAEKFHLPWPPGGEARSGAANAELPETAQEPRALLEEKPVPLRAFYLLAWGEPGIRQLTGSERLRQLVERASYRPDLLDACGQLAPHWERFAQLAQCVPVMEFSRPQDWNGMNSAMAILQSQW